MLKKEWTHRDNFPPSFFCGFLCGVHSILVAAVIRKMVAKATARWCGWRAGCGVSPEIRQMEGRRGEGGAEPLIGWGWHT